MDNVIGALIELLTPLANKAPWNLKGIYSMSDFESETNLKTTQFPCLVIAERGENTVSGPFGNTQTTSFRVTVRVVARSINPKKYRESENAGNVFAITSEVRRLLATDKRLSTISDGFTYSLGIISETTDRDFLFQTTFGHANVRDIMVTYSRLEDWTGPQNNQTTLETPAFPE